MNSILYSLGPARMPSLRETGKLVAHVHIRGSLGFNQLADRMVAQGMSVSKAEVMAVFETLAQALEAAMLDGWRVNFGGVFDMYPTVKGTFDDVTAPYDPDIHSVNVRAQCGPRIRKRVVASGVPERMEAPERSPLPLAFKDLSSATIDTMITPGHIGEVAGKRLKFNDAAPDEGIFLIPVAGGDTVQMTVTQRNKPASLVFLIPTLTPGADYRVEVRARLKPTEGIRVGRLPAVLRVSPLP